MAPLAMVTTYLAGLKAKLKRYRSANGQTFHKRNVLSLIVSSIDLKEIGRSPEHERTVSFSLSLTHRKNQHLHIGEERHLT